MVGFDDARELWNAKGVVALPPDALVIGDALIGVQVELAASRIARAMVAATRAGGVRALALRRGATR